MTETKSATLNILIEPSAKDILVAISGKHRVSLGHIVREAIHEYIQTHAPNGVCPECGNTEIEFGEDHFLDRGLCKSLTYTKCADCGAEID